MPLRWTAEAYSRLERAVARRDRISLWRRGTEYVVLPVEITMRARRDTLVATHPSTGENLVFVLDELDAFHVLD